MTRQCRRERAHIPAASRPAPAKAGQRGRPRARAAVHGAGLPRQRQARRQVALVTGGDSGIGRAVAVLFAREGADVAIVYLEEHADAEETKRCVEAEGRRCVLVAGDVQASRVLPRRPSSARCEASAGSTSWSTTPRSRSTPTRSRTSPTSASTDLPHQHLRLLPHGPGGAAAPEAGRLDHQHRLGDRASKAARSCSTTRRPRARSTRSRSRSRSNLIDKGIRVNAVAPGPGVDAAESGRSRRPRRSREFGKHTDMKRPAQPEELSPAYVFLAAPVCSGYITGIVLPVTGSVGAI